MVAMTFISSVIIFFLSRRNREMKLWRIFLLSNTFSFIFFFVYGQSPPVAQAPQYQFRKFLDDDRAFELLWSLTETGIQFEVNVRTTGYIGFGLSRTGKMSPADMVIGWVQDNFIYFGVSFKFSSLIL